MTLQEMIERIRYVAIRTSKGDINLNRLDSQILIEIILPRVMDAIIEKQTKTPEGLNLFRKDVEVTFAGGKGTMPPNIREEHYETINIIEDGKASYTSSWIEYTSTANVHTSEFTVRNGEIYYKLRGTAITDFSGDLTLAAICQLALPALADDQVDIRPALLEQIINFTASIVNGEIPLSTVSLDNSMINDPIEPENEREA